MLKTTGSILAARLWPLVGLAALIYVPFYALDGVLRATLKLTPHEISSMTGVLGLLLLPLAHGGLVHLADSALARRPGRIGEALLVGLKAWRRILVSYILAMLVWLGWAAVCVLPGALLLLAVGLHQDERRVLVFAIPAFAVVTRFLFLDSLTVLEGLEPHAARRRSAELANGQHVRLAICALCTLLPLTLLETLAPEIGDLLGEPGTAASIVIASATAALAGLLSIVPSVLFYVIYKETVAPGTAVPVQAASVTRLRPKGEP